MPTKTINRVLQGLLLGGLCQVVPVWASAPLQAGAVGQVNLVLGKAVIVHANGARETVKAGLPVSVGDRVETQGNAHVHIRFVDNELVSVRPLSRLEIERYDYRADDPAASVVKFNLIEGVARAVSGDGAKAARQNFRLNTPVAAIGVRGTDFVVSADELAVRALVNEGAIVVAPFSATCLADALGPCADNSLELSGGSRQVALVAAGAPAPILLATAGGAGAANLLAGTAVSVGGGNSGSGRDDVPPPKPANTESKSSGVVDLAIKDKDAQLPGPPPGPPPAPPPGPPPAPPIPEPPRYTPSETLSPEELTSSQLVWAWGRFGEDRPSRDLVVVRNSDSSMGRDRSISIKSLDDNYWLYRPAGSDIGKGLGELGFTLNLAQAFYTANGGVANVVDVLDGGLKVDFDQNKFSTWLEMNQTQLGIDSSYHRFESQGNIDSFENVRGFFNSPDLHGAVSLDGNAKEAGYSFQKTLPNGLLEGLTLWGSNR